MIRENQGGELAGIADQSALVIRFEDHAGPEAVGDVVERPDFSVLPMLRFERSNAGHKRKETSARDG
jgi:hypothetical protein